MRIAYLVHWNEGPSSGVFKKIVQQVSEWTRQGHTAGLFVFTRGDGEDWKKACCECEVVVHTWSGGRWSNLMDFRHLLSQVRRWSPQVVYHRYDHWYCGLPRLLRQFPSVLEINSHDLAEMNIQGGGTLARYVRSTTRGRVLRAAGGAVYVSRELAYAPSFSRYVRGSSIIGNGIDLAGYPLRGSRNPLTAPRVPLDAPDQKVHAAEWPDPEAAVRFIFIGTPNQPWHGVDLITELALLCPDWHFDLIGIDALEVAACCAEILRTAESGARELTGVPVNLNVHGELLQAQYQPLMDLADIAVGTLALYRKQMQEASPLKTREYLANGLPVITAYEDTDFPSGAPFLLQLPNEPYSLRNHLERIRIFVRAWRGRKVPRSAIIHIDTRTKEEQRLSYITSIVERGGES